MILRTFGFLENPGSSAREVSQLIFINIF